MRSLWLVPMLVLATTTPAAAQRAEVLHWPGRTVEVLGLNQWTAAMIQDSLDRYSPGDSLHSSGCAAILRYRLGFAEASVFTMPGADGAADRVVVTVVEPQDSARVRHREMPLDTTHSVADLAPAATLARRLPAAFQIGVMRYARARALGQRPEVPAYAQRDSAAIHELWDWLAARTAPEHASQARAVALGAPGIYDRMAAVAVLANFADQDSTWWTLVEVIREQDGPPRGVAGQVLRAIGAGPVRDVDWEPVAQSLHAILNGSALFQLPDVAMTLADQQVGPEWAVPLLGGGGGHALLAYASSSVFYLSHNAHALLRSLRGADLGTDVAAWEEWVASLPAPAAAGEASAADSAPTLVSHARARLLTKADTASHLWVIGTLMTVNNRSDCFAVMAPLHEAEGGGTRVYMLSGVHRLQISTRYDGTLDPETGEPRRYVPGADIRGETWREVSPAVLAAQPADCMPAVRPASRSAGSPL